MSEHDPKIRSLPRRILGGSIAIVVDLLLVLASLVLVAYFSINTHLGGEIVAQILRRALPSEVEIGRVGITPTLSRVVLVHVAFRHPGAKNETITLDGARVHLRIWPLLRSLLLEEHRLRLELGSIELLRPDVRLAFDKNGALKLLSLFTDGKPSSGPPTRVTLAFQRIVIRDGRLRIELPGLHSEHRIASLSMRMGFENEHLALHIEQLSLRDNRVTHSPAPTKDVPTPKPIVQRLPAIAIERFDWVGQQMTLGGLRMALEHSTLEARGRFSIAAPFPLDVELRATLDSHEPALARYIDRTTGRLTLRAKAKGSLDALDAALSLESDRLQRGRLILNKLAFALEASIRADGGERLVDVTLRKLKTDIANGHLEITNARYRSRWLSKKQTAVRHGVKLRVDWSGLDLQLLVGNLPDSLLDDARRRSLRHLLVGRSSGSLDLDRTRASDELDLALRLKVSRHRGRRPPLDWPIALELRSRAKIPLDPGGAPRFDDPTLALTIRSLRLALGSVTLRLDGTLEPIAQTMRLRFSANVPKLEVFSGIAGATLLGSLALTSGRLRGHFTKPSVRVKLDAKGLGLNGKALGDVSANLRLERGWLQLDPLELHSRFAEKVVVHGRVGLFRGDLTRMLRTLPIRVAKLRVVKANVGRLSGRKDLSALLDLEANGIATDSRRPLQHLKIKSISASLRHIAIGRDRISKITLEASITGTRLRLTKLLGELDRPQHRLVASGSFDLKTQLFDAEIEISKLNLGAITALRRRRLPVSGGLALKLSLRGTPKNVHAKGRIEVQRLGYDNLRLGNAVITLTDRGAGRIGITSANLFGLVLAPTSELKLRGFLPERIQVKLEAPKERPYDLRGLIPKLTHTLRVARFIGSIELGVDLRQAKTRMHARVELPTNGLTLATREVELTTPQTTPATIEWKKGYLRVAGLEIQSRVIASSDNPRPKAIPRLRLEGQFNPSQGVLDLLVRGSVDLAMLRLLPSISASRGTLALDVQVKGTLQDPRPVGSITFGSIVVVPRGLGQEVRIRRGGVLRLTKGPRSELIRAAFDPDKPLKVRFGDGTLQLAGFADLTTRGPETLDLRLTGAGVMFHKRGSLTITVSPDITLKGTRLTSPTKRTIAVRGDLQITEGLFEKKSSGLVGDTIREGNEVSSPIEESLPWIKEVALDLRVRGDRNFRVLVQKGKFGKAELEISTNLRAQGTIAHPKVVGRVKVEEGKISLGVLQRDFDIERGTIDFNGALATPTVDIVASTTVTYEIETGKPGSDDIEEKEVSVLVRVRVTGQLPDKLRVSFSSPNRLDQRSLVSLLMFGRPIETNKGNALSAMLLQQVANSMPSLFTNLIGEVDVQILQKLGYSISWAKSIGALRLKTRITETGTESKVQAGFRIRLGEHWWFTGRLNVNRTKQTNNYDSKLLYRIPLN